MPENKENKIVDIYADKRIISPMPRKPLTLEQVIAAMRKRQGERSNKAFAAELGVSEQYLGDLYKGRRTPGETVLSKLNLAKRVLYEQVA